MHGGQYLWGAPTFDQVRIGWDETRHATGKLAQFTQQRMEAVFPNGGIIRYRSLDDPDNARGHTADGIVIDEVGDVNERAWYEVLRPMLIDTGGWAWMVGTPRGHNWFWREWKAVGDRTDSAAWQAPTLGVAVQDGVLVRRPHPLENPHIAFSEIEHLWRTSPERIFRQEVLAEFVDDAGGVFRGVSQAINEPPAYSDQHEYVMGVDLARKVDFTACIVIDMSVSPAHVVAVDRFNQVDWSLQVQRIRALAERYHVRQVLVDQTGVGDPIVEQLRRDLSF